MDTSIALEQFENRLRKRFRHLQRWAKRDGIEAFRVYDRDIPEIAYAVDVYGPRLLVQRYEREQASDPTLIEAFADAAARATERERSMVTVKVRRKINRRDEQHEKTHEPGQSFVVREFGAKLLVNLNPYLDTGLFLDHRETRRRVSARAKGRCFLNLFCYTGSFTVHAALGGAQQSVSVDLSNTYLAWARRNFELNGLDLQHHQLVRADVMEWLRAARAQNAEFDMIVLDPPAFSSSKRMDSAFDVQRDHSPLIDACMLLLAPQGELVFSVNLRTFKLDTGIEQRYAVDNWTQKTIPEDFRNMRVHHCWCVRHR